MILHDPLREPKCDAEFTGAVSAPKDRFTVWFVVVTSCLFTTLIIMQSLREGKLSLPVTYDDVGYFNDAARRLQIFYDSGLVPFVTGLFRAPPHAPFATLVPIVGFSLLGMADWAPAAVNVVWVALLLYFIKLLLPDVPRWGYVVIAFSALCWPLTAAMVIECRPDIYAALLTVMGATLMFQVPFVTATMTRHHAVVAGLFGAALLAKPSISPITLLLYGVSLLVVVLIEGYRSPDRKFFGAAALRVAYCLAITIAIAFLYFAFTWREVYDYITMVVVSQSAVWSPQLGGLDTAGYYLWGSGGRTMMGVWLWIAILLVAVRFALGLLTREPFDRRTIGLFIVFVVAYALVSVPSVKSEFLGVIVPTFILAFYVLACGGIAGSLVRWGRYGRWGVAGFGAALLIVAGVVFTWPPRTDDSHFTVSRRHQIIHELGDYVESYAGDHAQELITFPVISQYFNGDALMFELLKRRLNWHKIKTSGAQWSLQEQLDAVGAADHVVLFDDDDPEILRWIPAARFYDQIKALVVEGSVFEKKRELIAADGVHKISVYTRKR